MNISSIDIRIIGFFRKISVPTARLGLFVVFFWFGILKVIGLSPAGPMVENLFNHTLGAMMPFLPFSVFMIGFALLECLIGVLFLIPGTERVVMPLLLIHLITTILPLFLLQEVTWSRFFVPTLEGQYIIKNLLIISAGIGIAANLHPIGNPKT